MRSKIIVGVKLTHDGAVAAVDAHSGELLFCHEMEKRFGAPRYSAMSSADQVLEVLSEEGYSLEEHVVGIALDGWKDDRAAKAQGWDACAGYDDDVLVVGRVQFSNGRQAQFLSFSHLNTHIAAASLTTPHGALRHYTLVWDGGMPPRVFSVNPMQRNATRIHIGDAHAISGTIYGLLAERFGPYKGRPLSYDTPGKIMSYLALGREVHELKLGIANAYIDCFGDGPMQLGQYPKGWVRERAWCAAIEREVEALRDVGRTMGDADVLLTVHNWMTDLLLRGLHHLVPRGEPLVFTGGCALNIKWNTALREGGYPALHVPPFPNDSGNAIGAAWCLWRHQMMHSALNATLPQWSVYAGPAIYSAVTRPGWKKSYDYMALRRLATHFVAEPDEPIVVMMARAELGPRALGHRSIMASAAKAEYKDKLNRIKGREPFRPVAPMCLEEDAPEWFSPGTRDPWMLFTHTALQPVMMPAGVHEDGTARLQTVSVQDERDLHALLSDYKHLTGVPVLLNTSANENGAGFFHDLASAQRWAERAGVRKVFCDGYLYTWVGDAT